MKAIVSPRSGSQADDTANSAPRLAGEIADANVRREKPLEPALQARMRTLAHEVRLIVRLVAETEDTAIVLRKITKEGRIEQQRVVTVVFDILGLQRDIGIVVVQEDGLARLQDRDALAMDAGSVEEDRAAGGAEEFDLAASIGKAATA